MENNNYWKTEKGQKFINKILDERPNFDMNEEEFQTLMARLRKRLTELPLHNVNNNKEKERMCTLKISGVAFSNENINNLAKLYLETIFYHMLSAEKSEQVSNLENLLGSDFLCEDLPSYKNRLDSIYESLLKLKIETEQEVEELFSELFAYGVFSESRPYKEIDEFKPIFEKDIDSDIVAISSINNDVHDIHNAKKSNLENNKKQETLVVNDAEME